MTPLTCVCWRWQTSGYRSTFGAAQINTLRRMVARHYQEPHRFCCVTDRLVGLDPEVEVIPPWNDFHDVPSPSGRRNPSCYRRLRAFHPEIAATFGPRFVSLDLDMVITGDLRPLLHRPEDFVIWGDVNPRTFYNGSLMLMTAGTRSKVWETFDPVKSPAASRAAGHFGSDQGWISHCLGPHEPKWTTDDGVYSYKNHLCQNQTKLPTNARVVVFHGDVDPWSDAGQKVGWIREHWQ